VQVIGARRAGYLKPQRIGLGSTDVMDMAAKN
jgi:hypothetical protein